MGVLAMIPLPLFCDPSPLSKGRGFRDQQKSVQQPLLPEISECHG